MSLHTIGRFIEYGGEYHKIYNILPVATFQTGVLQIINSNNIAKHQTTKYTLKNYYVNIHIYLFSYYSPLSLICVCYSKHQLMLCKYYSVWRVTIALSYINIHYVIMLLIFPKYRYHILYFPFDLRFNSSPGQ